MSSCLLHPPKVFRISGCDFDVIIDARCEPGIKEVAKTDNLLPYEKTGRNMVLYEVPTKPAHNTTTYHHFNSIHLTIQFKRQTFSSIPTLPLPLSKNISETYGYEKAKSLVTNARKREKVRTSTYSHYIKKNTDD